MKPGDIIIFNNTLKCIVTRITLYPSVRELLLNEGVKDTLSSGGDIEAGILSIESLPNYKEIIAENGVFAIVVK